MHLSGHDSMRSPHSVRTLSDPSLISSSHKLPLLSLTNDVDMSESQSHDSYASKQTHTFGSMTSHLCSQPTLSGSPSLSFFTIGPPTAPDDRARLGRVMSEANHPSQGFFRPPIRPPLYDWSLTITTCTYNLPHFFGAPPFFLYHLEVDTHFLYQD